MPFIKRVPHVLFKLQVGDGPVEGADTLGWNDRPTEHFFSGKRVIVFSIPGAFTPLSSSKQLPRYDDLYDELRNQGIDDIICVSVNDAKVMHQWGRYIVNEHITLLPDGAGEFTFKMGMLVDRSIFGLGLHSRQYSMLVDDGEIQKIFIDPEVGDDFPAGLCEVSDADTMLAFVRGTPSAIAYEPRLAFNQ